MSGPPRASIPNGDCRRRARRNSGRFGHSPWTTRRDLDPCRHGGAAAVQAGGSRLSCRRHHVFGTRGSARARKMPLLTPPSPRPAAPARYGLASLSTLERGCLSPLARSRAARSRRGPPDRPPHPRRRQPRQRGHRARSRARPAIASADHVAEHQRYGPRGHGPRTRRSAVCAGDAREPTRRRSARVAGGPRPYLRAMGFHAPWPTCRTGRGSVRSGRANGLQLWIEERVPAHWPSLGEVHHQVLPPRAARARRGARRGAHAAAPRAKVERP